MNKKIIGFISCILLIAVGIPTTTTLSMETKSNPQSEYQSTVNIYEQKLLEIQKEIKEKNASWIAGYTTVFGPNAEFEPSRGGVIDEEQSSDEYIPIELSGPLPSEWDWRNVNGVNWITPIRNQASCGSCVAFGSLGALEAVVQIEKGKIFDCDLSEAFLFFCGGGTCDNGMALSSAAKYIASPGVPDELCFPYQSNDMDCSNRAVNWNSRVVRASYGAVSGSSIKNALITYGPILTDFDVYEDFDAYSGGIYEYVSGDYVAGHAVAIIGYNDDPGYWICKNSWGKGWGETGYFRIKYNNCGIGQTGYYFNDLRGNVQPFSPTSPSPFDHAPNVDITVNLSWMPCQDVDNDTVYYTVYFTEGTSVKDTDIIASKSMTPFFRVSGLKYNTKYSWKVIVEDEHGSQNGDLKWQFDTRGPYEPFVNGTSDGKIRTSYTYTGSIPDSDIGGQQYSWFFDWGDDTNTGWIGPYGPYDDVSEQHEWMKKNNYVVKVRYKVDDVLSEWKTLPITMPYSYQWIAPFFEQLFQRFPNAFPLLRQIMGYKESPFFFLSF
jgi:C1A family cysteine protease